MAAGRAESVRLGAIEGVFHSTCRMARDMRSPTLPCGCRIRSPWGGGRDRRTRGGGRPHQLAGGGMGFAPSSFRNTLGSLALPPSVACGIRRSRAPSHPSRKFRQQQHHPPQPYFGHNPTSGALPVRRGGSLSPPRRGVGASREALSRALEGSSGGQLPGWGWGLSDQAGLVYSPGGVGERLSSTQVLQRSPKTPTCPWGGEQRGQSCTPLALVPKAERVASAVAFPGASRPG